MSGGREPRHAGVEARPKGAVEELALFGGTPLFTDTLHVGAPNVGNRAELQRRLEGMFDRNWLTNDGPLVRELEAAIAQFLGVRHCISMCNGTIALEIAIRALDLEGEVLVPSFTFVASAHALWWQKIRPVFCDIDRTTHCLDPAAVESRIGSRTTGILAVNLWGRPGPIEELEAIAERHHLQILFDSAHAFGSSHRGRMIGSFGCCEVLSFHATKVFNTLEGGAVVTNDDRLAEKVRLMRNFGFAGLDKVIYCGTNGKMNEASAAVGLTNLEAFPGFVAWNKAAYDAYREALSAIAGIRLVEHPQGERSNYQYVACEIGAEFGLGRDDLVRILHAEKVRARRYFWPGCHRMEPYASLFAEEGSHLPVTEAVASRILVLPTGGASGAQNARRIGALLAWLGERATEITRRLRQADQRGPR
jgi:dTDP-4-amino-4,6-dideoxygalactose transaminase